MRLRSEFKEDGANFLAELIEKLFVPKGGQERNQDRDQKVMWTFEPTRMFLSLDDSVLSDPSYVELRCNWLFHQYKSVSQWAGGRICVIASARELAAALADKRQRRRKVVMRLTKMETAAGAGSGASGGGAGGGAASSSGNSGPGASAAAAAAAASEELKVPALMFKTEDPQQKSSQTTYVAVRVVQDNALWVCPSLPSRSEAVEIHFADITMLKHLLDRYRAIGVTNVQCVVKREADASAIQFEALSGGSCSSSSSWSGQLEVLTAWRFPSNNTVVLLAASGGLGLVPPATRCLTASGGFPPTMQHGV